MADNFRALATPVSALLARNERYSKTSTLPTSEGRVMATLFSCRKIINCRTSVRYARRVALLLFFPDRGMFGVHAKNYRFVKRGVRKSFPSEFSDISSVRQCFSCMILHLFTRLKWGIEASSEIECFPYTMDLKKNLGTQITVFIDSVWYFTKRCNKLHELQTYPKFLHDHG